jgi:hypothetical protein
VFNEYRHTLDIYLVVKTYQNIGGEAKKMVQKYKIVFLQYTDKIGKELKIFYKSKI